MATDIQSFIEETTGGVDFIDAELTRIFRTTHLVLPKKRDLAVTTYGRLLGAALDELPRFGGSWIPSRNFWITSHLDWLFAKWQNSLILVHGAQLPFLWQTTADQWCIVIGTDDQSECEWPMHHCNILGCVGARWTCGRMSGGRCNTMIGVTDGKVYHLGIGDSSFDRHHVLEVLIISVLYSSKVTLSTSCPSRARQSSLTLTSAIRQTPAKTCNRWDYSMDH